MTVSYTMPRNTTGDREEHFMLSSRSFPSEGASDSPAILCVDERVFTQDCIIKVLRTEFPLLRVLGIRTTEELNRLEGVRVRLILLCAERAGATLADDLRRLKLAFPEIPIALVSCGQDHETVREATSLGIAGLIPKAESLESAIAAIQLILAGGTYYPPCGETEDELAAQPRERIPVPAPQSTHGNGVPITNEPNVGFAPRESLAAMIPLQPSQDYQGGIAGVRETDLRFSLREMQVLAALQQGRSNKVIARELQLSENTIKVHVHHIMQKLGASNRTEAALKAARLLPRLMLGTSHPVLPSPDSVN